MNTLPVHGLETVCHSQHTISPPCFVMLCEDVTHTLELEDTARVDQHIMVSTWNYAVSTKSMVSDFCR